MGWEDNHIFNLKEGEEYELEWDEEVIEMGEEGTRHASSMSENDRENNQSAKVFLLNGKPLTFKESTKKATFAETHVRVTTYLEKNIYQIIQMLKTHNQIESITKFINDSVKEYLMKKYQE